MAARLRFSGSGDYLNTLDNGAIVHAGNSTTGTPMAGNLTHGFWVMHGGGDARDRDIAGEGHPGTPGDGSSIISVNASLFGFSQTNGRGYGTDLTGYNANYDFNLDGDNGDDLIQFAKCFGSQWSF
jgi:hypothetical protein